MTKAEHQRLYRQRHPEYCERQRKIKTPTKRTDVRRAAERRRYALNPAKKIAQVIARKKLRYQTDPVFALTYRLRNSIGQRIRNVLKSQTKSAHTIELLGCSIESFMLYLESKFKDGMSWTNYGLWEIDHILPCAIFDLTRRDHQLRCFHFSNQQPLWAVINRQKGARVLI